MGYEESICHKILDHFQDRKQLLYILRILKNEFLLNLMIFDLFAKYHYALD